MLALKMGRFFAFLPDALINLDSKHVIAAFQLAEHHLPECFLHVCVKKDLTTLLIVVIKNKKLVLCRRTEGSR